MDKRGLIKSTGVISIATAISRVLGFIRDIVIARFFGTAIYAQAFVVAFRIPNLLRDLIGEGAVNSAFVPVLTDTMTKKGKKEFWALTQVMLNILFWGLLAATVIGVLASPIIVKLIAPGFFADKEKFQITVLLTRMLFPFLILVGLWAYAMGVLNTLGCFGPPAFGPCLMNLSIILCAVWFGENILGLTTGVLAGGALQLALQFPSLYHSGWRMRITGEFAHPGAKRIGILLVPRIMGASVYQINVFVSTILASLSSIVGDGAVAALYYANRVWQLPLGIFGIALAQAALPAMSKHVAASEIGKLKEMISFSMKVLFFILTPASVGLIVLGRPITRILFERGAFTQYSTEITSSALLFYAAGLVACGGVKILVNAFYSMHDTMTPVKSAALSLALNIALSAALMWPLKVGGLALATSISATFNFFALYFLLSKRLGGLQARVLVESFLRIAAASVIMGIVLKLYMLMFPELRILGLVAAIMIGIGSFVAASRLCGVKELKDLLRWILARR